ncbi:MAG: hypothetical protein IJL98_04850 [Lachnospiraceae bacterium]|nr:hypothetical protein [Lachnospiraceae bacterium]
MFIAYGKTEDEAKQWLTKNGWEVLKGSANAGLGKASAFDKEIAAVISIRRTDKVSEAVTDLAVMNMKGGYSLAAYQNLLDQKKTEIDEYIRHFFRVIEEFRDNYNGKGSALGKQRADLAYSLLNRFFDRDPNSTYAVNDTGMKLGDLFLVPLMQEMEDDAEMVWFETYCEKNGLWPKDSEKEADYQARAGKFLNDLQKTDPGQYDAEYNRFSSDSILYENLFEVSYKGEWGAKLGDFFNPVNGKNYGTEEAFLPFAAALSEGQRAASELVSLNSLLLTGLIDQDGLRYALPDVEKLLKENDSAAGDLDIYTGINRAVFRNGVALTNRAMMEQNMGRSSVYDNLFDNLGILTISAYSAAVVGVTMMIAGGVMIAKGSTHTITTVTSTIEATKKNIDTYRNWMEIAENVLEFFVKDGTADNVELIQADYDRYKKIYDTRRKRISGSRLL